GRGPLPDVACHLDATGRTDAAGVRACGRGGEAAPVETRLEPHPGLPPRVAELPLVRVPAGGALPFDLGRQALSRPAREGLRLVEGDVLYRLPGRDRLAPAGADPLPPVPPALPVERCARLLALPPGPARLAPVALRPIPAAVDELRELAARHRRTVDAERPELDLVRLELVVVRPVLVLGAERE